jgi:hypothetical protein
MNRTLITAALLAGAVLSLAGCSGAPAGPSVEGAEAGAYDLWPTEVVEFPDIPLVEGVPARDNGCFQPEGTYAICTAEFEDSDSNLAELEQHFRDAGFEVTEGAAGQWQYAKGEITVSVSRIGTNDPATISLDLSDRS